MQATTPSDPKGANRIRDSLLEFANNEGALYDDVLRQYARERLLQRLGSSPWGDQFILQGAPAIEVRLGVPHRRLRTLDLVCRGPGTAQDVNALIAAISQGGDDGLTIDAGSVRCASAGGGAGSVLRTKLFAYLDSAQIPVQLDVSFDQHLEPPPDAMQLPSMLDQPGAATMEVASFDAIAAGKIHWIVERGALKARMKDFYDVWLCAQVDPLEELDLALRTTFESRGTPLPVAGDVPDVLAARYVNGKHAAGQWEAFNRKEGPSADLEFCDVHHALQRAALPVFAALAELDHP